MAYTGSSDQSNICLGEGDSKIIHDVFSEQMTEEVFARLKAEVPWQQMHHAGGLVPRLVCCQALIDVQDGSMPIYRHPADESLPTKHFTQTVDDMRREVEQIAGHGINHVLIQLYRSGEDFISEHSDKTLDIARESSIVNVSLGAQRTMRLRTKKSTNSSTTSGRVTQFMPMPHGSVFILGLKTNMRWLHGVRADKRPLKERSEAERAFRGERISLTFRKISTFISGDGSYIWGQGATQKARDARLPVINGDFERSQELINAFGLENQQSEFAWEEVYGQGFDVLHLATPPGDSIITTPTTTADANIEEQASVR